MTPADPLALEALFAQKTCAPAHYWQNNWKLQLLPRACSKVGIFGHGCSAAQSARRAFAARAAKVYYDCSVCEGLALLWQQLLGSWPSHFVGTYIRLSVATWHARFCNLYLAHGRGGSVQRRLCPCSRAVQGAAGSERHSVRHSRNALCKWLAYAGSAACAAAGQAVNCNRPHDGPCLLDDHQCVQRGSTNVWGPQRNSPVASHCADRSNAARKRAPVRPAAVVEMHAVPLCQLGTVRRRKRARLPLHVGMRR